MTEIKKIEGFPPGPWVGGGNGIWKEGKLLATVTMYKPDLSDESEATKTVSLIAYAPELYSIALEQQKEIERLNKLYNDALGALKNVSEGWGESDAEIERLKGLLQNLVEGIWRTDPFREDETKEQYWQQFKTDNQL